jgi:hypothetical protein
VAYETALGIAPLTPADAGDPDVYPWSLWAIRISPMDGPVQHRNEQNDLQDLLSFTEE